MRTTLFFFLLFICASVQAQTPLSLASDIWPPFTDEDGKKAIALDIVNHALDRDQQEVNYAISNFDEVLSQIYEGEIEGSAALWYTADRAEYLEYSAPYLQNQLILVAKKGTDVEFSSLDQLEGKSVGAVENYAYTDPSSSTPDVNFVYSQSDQQNLELLLSGRVDYILVDAVLIQYLLKYQINDVTRLLEIGTNPLITKTLHLAIRKDVPNAKGIITKFNARVEEMKAVGSYNKILGLNWIRTDVDGDGNYELVLDGSSAGTEEPTQVYNLLHQEGPSSQDRYFIDGQIYNTWSDVPNNYKQEIALETSPDLDHIGFKISLNK